MTVMHIKCFESLVHGRNKLTSEMNDSKKQAQNALSDLSCVLKEKKSLVEKI